MDWDISERTDKKIFAPSEDPWPLSQIIPKVCVFAINGDHEVDKLSVKLNSV